MFKSKGKTYMVEEPSQVKQLSLNHECKIGLTMNIRNHRETVLNGHRRSGLDLEDRPHNISKDNLRQ
jgi:hypothetical protein